MVPRICRVTTKRRGQAATGSKERVLHVLAAQPSPYIGNVQVGQVQVVDRRHDVRKKVLAGHDCALAGKLSRHQRKVF